MEVEDYPLAWCDFECVISEGSYGAGAVIVWDAGTYRTLASDDDAPPIADALANGHARVWLEGRKIRGGFTLRRIRGGDKPEWLLMKRRDEHADPRRDPVTSEPQSVVSGRTLEEVARVGSP